MTGKPQTGFYSIMKLFPQSPVLTEEDKQRLTSQKFLRSWNCLNAALKEHSPDVGDLKKLIAMEVGSRSPRRPIVEKLIVRLQKREREDIYNNIKMHKDLK